MKHLILFALALVFLLSSAFVPRIHTGTIRPSEPAANQGDLHLSAPRPNPFRVQTELTLTARKTQLIAVEVVNLTGQRQAFLFEGMLREGKPQTIRFEAKNLPSGVYYFLIRGESLLTSRKVVLAR